MNDEGPTINPFKDPKEIELYHIDAGIPIPSKESKYSVLGRLKVGESVLFHVPRSASLSPAIHRIQLATANDPDPAMRKRFVRKAVEGGVRVWRVEPGTKLMTEPPITPAPRKRKPKEQSEGHPAIGMGTSSLVTWSAQQKWESRKHRRNSLPKALGPFRTVPGGRNKTPLNSLRKLIYCKGRSRWRSRRRKRSARGCISNSGTYPSMRVDLHNRRLPGRRPRGGRR